MAEKLCSVEACGRPRMARGLCNTHYTRLRRHGSINADIPIGRIRVIYVERTCSLPGCDGKHHARGYCFRHWQRLHRHGDPAVTKPRGRPAHKPVTHAMIVARRLAARKVAA